MKGTWKRHRAERLKRREGRRKFVGKQVEKEYKKRAKEYIKNVRKFLDKVDLNKVYMKESEAKQVFMASLSTEIAGVMDLKKEGNKSILFFPKKEVEVLAGDRRSVDISYFKLMKEEGKTFFHTHPLAGMPLPNVKREVEELKKRLKGKITREEKRKLKKQKAKLEDLLESFGGKLIEKSAKPSVIDKFYSFRGVPLVTISVDPQMKLKIFITYRGNTHRVKFI